MYWFVKSYSSHTVPPAPFGINDGVPTSKMPHPQAQATARPGAKAIRKTAAISRRPNLFETLNRYAIAFAKGLISELRRINFSRQLSDLKPPTENAQDREQLRCLKSPFRKICLLDDGAQTSFGGGVSGAFL